MASPSILEQRVAEMVRGYLDLHNECNALRLQLGQRDKKIADLEDLCQRLKKQLDTTSKDRFFLKELQDERKVLKRKLETALSRLISLEKEYPS